MDEFVVVDPDWVTTHREDDNIRLVDVRDAWEFEGIGHIPGAVNIPFDEFRDPSDVDRGMLPGADVFAELLGEAGIRREDTLVAYDDTHGVFAARFVVTAREYGHPDVRLLNGDYSAWARAFATTTDATSIAATLYDASPITASESPIISSDAVRAALESDATLVDTREEAEFAEAHLPGAIRFNWDRVLDRETRGLRPDSEIQAMLNANGILRDRPIILYCNTARRISHTYLILLGLGYEDLSFYEGSLTEWLGEDGAIERSN